MDVLAPLKQYFFIFLFCFIFVFIYLFFQNSGNKNTHKVTNHLNFENEGFFHFMQNFMQAQLANVKTFFDPETGNIWVWGQWH